MGYSDDIGSLLTTLSGVFAFMIDLGYYVCGFLCLFSFRDTGMVGFGALTVITVWVGNLGHCGVGTHAHSWCSLWAGFFSSGFFSLFRGGGVARLARSSLLFFLSSALCLAILRMALESQLRQGVDMC